MTNSGKYTGNNSQKLKYKNKHRAFLITIHKPQDSVRSAVSLQASHDPNCLEFANLSATFSYLEALLEHDSSQA